jgi:NAD(P)-dependent dehydrogenase (short-subunit alcohol dehydrogenase family)
MMLKDKVAVITGIGPGMGSEIALLFAREGAKLIIGARNEARIEKLAKELRDKGHDVIAKTTGDYKSIDEADPEQWRRVMDCNFFGAMHLVQVSTPSMIERGGGEIILVNSGASFLPHVGLASYAASKAALESLVRSLAIELGPKGIRANGIHLGHGIIDNAPYISQQQELTCTPQGFSAPGAFAMAGVTAADIDVLAIYDCFSITALMQIEDMGFCKKGEGGAFVEGGRLRYDNPRSKGGLPTNTHGGLLSHAYVLGIAHVIELVKQLRGTSPNQVEMAELAAYAGFTADEASTLILRRA